MLKTISNRVLAASVAGLIAATATPAFAGDLAQTVTMDEEMAPEGEFIVIENGHVDLGALLVDGTPELRARDDTGANPVWRKPQDIVLHLDESAVQTLPEGKDFDFVGAKPGDQVWVVPQTEIADVPWLGWNTQAPSLIEAVDRGVEVSFLGHSGPGEFSLFLHNGGFGEPDVLFSTAKPADDKFWVDLNTHTHANWTFTEPGIHQVGLKFSAQGADGTPLETQGTITFAVGEEADPAQLRALEWNPNEASSIADGWGSNRGLYIGVGAGVLVLLALVGLGIVLRGWKGPHNA